jgi:hypothetical protein
MKKLQKLNFSTFQFFYARGDILEMQQSTLADWCDLNTEAKKEGYLEKMVVFDLSSRFKSKSTLFLLVVFCSITGILY